MITSAINADLHTSSLAARFRDGPRVFAPEQAAERFESWLVDVSSEQADAIRDVLRSAPALAAALHSIAEASPYLFDLIRADAARLLRLVRSDPDQRFAALLETAATEVAAASDEDSVMASLRRLKAEAALLIALCDIGGIWPVMTVTKALTDLAVGGVQMALRFLMRQEAARGRLNPTNPDMPEQDSGLVVLAMGKMGAGELNYSSDIDLIVFYDLDAPTLAPDIEPQPFFVRVTQALSRILQQRRPDGYVFRVDLRLRPDPASTPVALSTVSALNYYEREGRT